MRKPVIALLTLGVLFTLGVLRGVDMWWWRAQTLNTASARASNLAFILTQYFQESLAAGDGALRQLALHSRRIGGPAASQAAWGPSLASARAGLRNMGAISVADATGIIRHSTQPLIVGQSRREESAFQAARRRPERPARRQHAVSHVVDRKTFVIPFARPLFTEDGSFDGIVVASMVPAAMRGLFQTMDVGKRGVVWVFHPDGVVLFREPSATNPLGEPAGANPIFAAAKRSGEPGRSASALRPGEPTLLTAFRSTTAPPLIVAVSLDRDEVLQDVRRQSREATAFFLVLTLTMIGTLFVLFRQMDEKAEAEGALARARQFEADELRTANERLEKALRLEQEFLMTVSHELRTPLTAIHGWARMLATGTAPRTAASGRRAAIERNARAQTRLVEDLLDMSRVVGGKLRLDIRDVNLADVLREAVETMTPAVDAKQIRIEVTIDDGVGPIAATPIVCSRSSGTCCRTRSSSRRRRAGWSCMFSAPARRSRSSCATRARASRRSSCRTCSTGFVRKTRARSGGSAASASDSPSSAPGRAAWRIR